jgi:hypothetical protein
LAAEALMEEVVAEAVAVVEDGDEEAVEVAAEVVDADRAVTKEIAMAVGFAKGNTDGSIMDKQILEHYDNE